jgi:3-oxoacyl-[acyl-carrier-protein] synthase-1
MSTPMKLAVLGAGAVTSVGNSLPATAAAIRAGLDNFQDTYFRGQRGEPLPGAAMSLGLSESGARVGGATKLGTALAWAVREAIESAGVRSPLPDSVPLLFLGDDTRPAPLVDAAHLCQKSIAPLFESPERLHLQAFTGGEAACVDALQAAREFLAQGAPYVLIAASDSWLRTSDIAHALAHQRLLDTEVSSGFVPGEAAAALLITRDVERAPLQIRGVGVAEEAATLLSDEPCHGKGLAQATRQALNESGWQAHEIHLRLSDMAGESFFAEELSSAWARVLRASQPPGHGRIFPAASTGHVGCAFGPLMLALAWQLAKRQRMPGPKVLIQLSSSHTLRGAIAAYAGAA